jgi:antitoxin VapB
MTLDIRDQDVDRLAETLASMAGLSKTDAVRMASAGEPQRRERSLAGFPACIEPRSRITSPRSRAPA